MTSDRVYRLDDNGKVIGYWTLIDNEPFTRSLRDLKQPQTKEILIDMKNYDMALDDLKEVDK